MNTIQLSQAEITQESVADMFYRWTLFIEGTEKTQQTYTRAVRLFIQYLRENNITAPTKEDVRAYRDMLKESHKATTVQAYLIAIRQFFRWLEEESIYPDITAHIKPGVKQSKEHLKDYLTTAQCKDFLQGFNQETAQGRRDYAIALLMLTSGLRTIEVIRANIGDLRPIADSLCLYIQGKGHTEKDQYVKVAPMVEKAIRESLADRPTATDQEPLFCSLANKNYGARLTTRSCSRIIKEHLVAVGLNSDRLTAHSLRHTTATLNLLNGGSLEETQMLLRHSSINTTMRYNHSLSRASNNSELRVEQAILG